MGGKNMKKKLVSLILIMVLCVTLAPAATASTTVESSPVSVSKTSVAITTNKDLYCWGQNRSGQVGNGTKTYQATPQKILSNVEFALTNEITVAITTNKDLYVWGNNNFGQTGDVKGYESAPIVFNRVTAAGTVTPFKVLSNVASVTTDGESIFAITTNGDLYAWGRNQYGQIGNGKSGKDEVQTTPVKVLSNIASVAMSKGTNSRGVIAAIATNGDLYTWGRNESGQVGNGKSGKDEVQKTPVKVLSDVVSLTTSGGHLAAITTNADLYCWGTNWFGQVGNGTREHQTKPVKVLSNVASVSTSNTTIAITNNGDLYAWGYTEMGQVGNDKQMPEDSQTTPVKVLSNVVSATVSYTNTSAITTNGDLYVWGANGDYQIGNGSFKTQATPFKVLSNVASFTDDIGGNPVAVTKNGDLYTWGNNADGQIGNGQSGLTDDPLSGGIKQKTPVKVLSNVVSASIIDHVSSAVTKNGDLYCWGNNREGSVGNGTTINQTTPVKVLSSIRLANAAPVAPALTATPTASKVLVDGQNVAFDAYNIAGNNYFKLRDLAYVLDGSVKQFSVSWDGSNNAIALKSGEGYTVVGGEMATKGTAAVTPKATTSRITKNASLIALKAYNIGGNNYFKLRDIGEAFDFDISWNNDVKTIMIDTASTYTAD